MTEVETAKMSERGQIIIPKEIRDYVGATDSTIFTIMPLDRDTIIMKRLDTMRLVQEFRGIRKTIKKKLSSEEINTEIHEARRPARS